jgi:hypothetical protein
MPPGPADLPGLLRSVLRRDRARSPALAVAAVSRWDPRWEAIQVEAVPRQPTGSVRGKAGTVGTTNASTSENSRDTGSARNFPVANQGKMSAYIGDRRMCIPK